MKQRNQEILEFVTKAIIANGGFYFRKELCNCDVSVGSSPCRYCAIWHALHRTFHYMKDIVDDATTTIVAPDGMSIQEFLKKCMDFVDKKSDSGGVETLSAQAETARAGTPLVITDAHAEPVVVGVSPAGESPFMGNLVAQCCPICVGRGRLPRNFFGEVSSTSIAPIACHACAGTGLLWTKGDLRVVSPKSDSGGVEVLTGAEEESSKDGVTRVRPGPPSTGVESKTPTAVTPFNEEARRARFEDLFQLIDKRRYRDLPGWPGEGRALTHEPP